MKRADNLTVELTSPGTNDTSPVCRLFHAGRDTGRILAGAVLEAGLQLETERLLFLTHDIPYEESLGIYLLGSAFEILDQATLLWPYNTGHFAGLETLGDRRLRFTFLGEGFWELEVLKTARFRLPLIGSPLGVVRPFGFSRRFTLRHHR